MEFVVAVRFKGTSTNLTQWRASVAPHVGELVTLAPLTKADKPQHFRVAQVEWIAAPTRGVSDLAVVVFVEAVQAGQII